MNECLPSHAVLLAGASNFQIILAGKLQSVADVVFICNSYHTVDRGFVQMAGIIGKPAELFKRNRCRLWFRDQDSGFPLVGIVREDEVAFGTVRDLGIGLLDLRAQDLDV